MSDDNWVDAYRRLSGVDRPFDVEGMSRRRFLQAIAAGVSLPVLLESGFASRALASVATDPLAPGEGILVLVGMYGGNDGLNMVVPHGSSDYYRRRANIAVDPSSVLPLDSSTGLHPELTEVKSLWDRGRVAVVQGVGVVPADFSHFTSMATWMKGGSSSVTPGTGWVGRWLDGHGATSPFSVVTLGQSVGLHLLGRTGRGTAIGYSGSMFGTNLDPRYRRHYATLRRFDDVAVGGWYDAIASVISLELDVAEAIASMTTGTLPSSELAAKMTMAARLINADVGCRVIDMGFGSFDTHANEVVDHTRRMREFNEALVAFRTELAPALDDRVTIMTWSEFGRTITSTASGGTDHGSSNSLFVIGAGVAGGLKGSMPSLAGNADRPNATVDFRSVYRGVIDGWLGGDSTAILGGTYENMSLFRSGPGVGVAPPRTAPGSGTPLGDFNAVTPVRVFDSRSGDRPLGPGESVAVAVAGVGGLPASGMIAVALNVTATGSTEDSYFTIWPTGGVRPEASTLNPRPGVTVPNFAVVPVGTDGSVSVFNARGRSHLLVDVVGWYGTVSADRLLPLVPTRLLDSRNGTGGRTTPLGPGESLDLVVTDTGGVPSSGVSSVILNVTATDVTRSSYLTVWPSGQPRPVASSLNVHPGQTVANLVFATVGEGGRVSIFNESGTTNLVVDVCGCFSTSGNGRFVGVTPHRVLDSRNALGVMGPIRAGQTFPLTIEGLPSTTIAVMLNVTITEPTTATYATIWPAGESRPEASNLNARAKETIANAAVVGLGNDGRILFFNESGSAHYVVDLLGYYMV